MAAKGPSQRKNRISSLVYSTLGANLGIVLPTEEKEVFVEPGEEAENGGNEGDSTARPQSETAEQEEEELELEGDTSEVNSMASKNVPLGRLYSSPASSSSFQTKQARLAFKSKTGAGSLSSNEQATLSTENGERTVSPLSPVIAVSKQLKEQISPKNSIGELNPSLKERQHKERVSTLERDSIVGVPVSWNEDAISNRHLWHNVDTREACYLADTQYCQQLKLFHPRRQKLKCSACKIVVHDTCVKQLYYEDHGCKLSFREIKQKVKETSTCHHFLNRRKAAGKCRKCDRGFGNWRKFNLRDIVGISCSWCGVSYHLACFNEGLRQDPCSMGPLQNLIIPPSWIVRVPPVQVSGGAAASYSGSSEAHVSPKGSTRRKSKRSRRRRTDDRASKYFTVKPISSRQHKPLIVFINPKSGGNQGARLIQTFQGLLNPRQVFDLTQGGPEFGLKLFQGVSNIRVLACGGDGTAGWIFSILDKLDIRPIPPIAILPLGTGNDLARVFGWGGGYTDEPIEKILLHVEEGPVEEMDRWQLSVFENPLGQRDADGADDTPLHVINNYFSIGEDAQVTLEFHLEREANPEKFSSRYKNKMQYARLGGKSMFLRRFLTLTDHIKLYGDGEDLTEKIQNLKLEAICFLNIPSYASGTNAWGNSRDRVFKPPTTDDGKIEIVGFTTSTLARLQVGLAHGERVAQCNHIKLVTNKAFPIQIDGEAVKLQPSVIMVGWKNKAAIVRKVARIHLEAPLRGVRPNDRIKLSVSKVTSDQYDRLHSDLSEIRKKAVALGLVVATSQDTLKAVRQQVEHFTVETDEDEESHLSQNWRYLDVANSGRVDRMFQVTPDQEETMLIGDMLSDGLLVVELSPSPVSTPSVEAHPSILLSPEAEGLPPLVTSTAALKRNAFERNSSYEYATNSKSESPPPLDGAAAAGLEVPTQQLSYGTESSPSDTPIPSDDEATSLLPTRIVDTGSDTDNDAATVTAVQKGLLDSVKRANLKKVKDYHSRGAKLLEVDPNGWTPLHHAARLDKKEVVQYILDNIPKEGLDIVEDEKLQTALHKAAWYGHVEVSKMLVEKGASLDRLDYQGNTVFDKSVQSSNKELQKYIQGQLNKAKDLGSDEIAI